METPDLAHAVITPYQIIAHVLQSKMVHPGRYSCDTGTIRNATVDLGTPLLFNGNEIGTLTGKQFHSHTKSLFLYFEHNLIDAMDATVPYLWCAPTIEPKMLQCPACNSYYEQGDSPCSCIFACNSISLLKIHITAVTFYDARNDDENAADFRSDLLRDFFSGAVGRIELFDPI